MIVELRTYTCTPGCLPAVHDRFINDVLPIWHELGIESIGFFTPADEASESLTYLLRWHSKAEQEEKWQRFLVDPRWVARRPLTELNGPLVQTVVSRFLQPTTYSMMRA
ncbi:NIPSNAP family protein [Pseudomonas syringae]|uniref:NIPSNAP domain-containing protein n=1 Tax=Pseudomonas syringae TaxID=317 RepID=A0A085V8K6_PSESX|nr:NIPSNAP family protein [Pseudomonas syringae]KFE51769.1 hypothetical protein IV02_11355 [Pseudomonas syringae]